VENVTDYRVGSPFAQEPTAPPADNRSRSEGPQTRDSVGSAVTGAVTGELAGGGSPFAAEHPETAANRYRSLQPEAIGDGVWGQTAAAGAYAAVILLAFVAASWSLFPAGGVAVAALGVVVSLLGLSSQRNRLATVTLSLHGALFFACYLRAI
jgi:hypothetical protein